MISVRECTKLYNKMLKEHQKEVEPNRINCYKCNRCGTITKTIEVDDGVTPFAYTCESCGHPFAKSTFYDDLLLNKDLHKNGIDLH